MKKNKGFTLIELLAIIIIVGIVFTIATLNVGNIKAKINEKILQKKLSTILETMRVYAEENEEDIFNESSSTWQTIEDALNKNNIIESSETDKTGKKVILSNVNNESINKIKIIMYKKNNRIYSCLDSTTEEGDSIESILGITDDDDDSIISSYKCSNNINSETSTQLCGEGQYKYFDKCIECPVGTYSSGINALACTPCSNGQTTDKEGSSSCDKSCAQTSVTTWKDTYWYDNTAHNICTISKCNGGYSLDTTNNTCNKCDAGTYGDGYTCKACKANTYSNAGASECTRCEKYQKRDSNEEECSDCTNRKDKETNEIAVEDYKVFTVGDESSTCQIENCKPGYELDKINNECNKCNIANAKTYDTTQLNTCVVATCESGYELVDNTCQKCSNYDDSKIDSWNENTCTINKCKTDYRLDSTNNKCICNNYIEDVTVYKDGINNGTCKIKKCSNSNYTLDTEKNKCTRYKFSGDITFPNPSYIHFEGNDGDTWYGLTIHYEAVYNEEKDITTVTFSNLKVAYQYGGPRILLGCPGPYNDNDLSNSNACMKKYTPCNDQDSLKQGIYVKGENETEDEWILLSDESWSACNNAVIITSNSAWNYNTAQLTGGYAAMKTRTIHHNGQYEKCQVKFYFQIVQDKGSSWTYKRSTNFVDKTYSFECMS